MPKSDQINSERRLSPAEARARFLASSQGQQALTEHQIELSNRALAYTRARANELRTVRGPVKK